MSAAQEPTAEERLLAEDAAERLRAHRHTANGHRVSAELGTHAGRAAADVIQCLACGDYLKNRHGSTDPPRVCPEAPLDAVELP